jgi:replicative DNA helicase
MPSAAGAPQNQEAEESLLGACMNGAPTTYFECVGAGVSPDDFYRRSHGYIFEAVGRLCAAGVVPDAVSVVDELQKTPSPPDFDGQAVNMLDAVGGRVRVFEIATIGHVSANAPHHARIVRDHALRRGLVRESQDAARSLLDGFTFEDVLDRFERSVEGLRARSAARENLHAAEKLAERFYLKRQNPPEEEDDGFPFPLGLSLRFRRGSMYVVSGYTGDGKTVFALQCLRALCEHGARVGYASLEMSGDELVDRLVSQFGVPYEEAQSGRVSEPFRERAEAAEATIADWPFDVLDDEEANPATIRRWALAGKYDAVIIDHLHRIDFADRFEIERTIRSLRNMAKRLAIPVVLLAQLNRASDKKNPFPRPSLSSLRETAVLEHEAAMVAFVYRHRDEETFDPTSVAEFIVAKNRFGKTGLRPLMFDGSRQRYALPAHAPR